MVRSVLRKTRTSSDSQILEKVRSSLKTPRNIFTLFINKLSLSNCCFCHTSNLVLLGRGGLVRRGRTFLSLPSLDPNLSSPRKPSQMGRLSFFSVAFCCSLMITDHLHYAQFFHVVFQRLKITGSSRCIKDSCWIKQLSDIITCY